MNRLRKPGNRKGFDWPLYCRAFLLTLGLLFLLVPCMAWWTQGGRSEEWTPFAWGLFYGVTALGVMLSMTAFLASRRAVEKWAEATGSHELLLVVMIVAVPVYFVLKWFVKGTK